MNKIIKIISILTALSSLSACVVLTEVSSSTSSTIDAVTPDITLNTFVNKRYIAIRHDAAKGAGENLDALAQLMGEQNKPVFAQQMKTHFERIFKDVERPVQIIARIEAQMKLTKG